MLPNATADGMKDTKSTLDQLTELGRRLPAAGGSPPARSVGAGSSDKALESSSLLAAIDLSTAAPRSLDAATAAARRDGIDAVEHAFGDLWRAIEHGFVEVAALEVHTLAEGAEILVHVVGKVFSAVVHFAEQVWDVVETVFKTIGADLEKLVRWLGFMFRWDDILQTHRVLRGVVTAGLADLRTRLAEGDALVDRGVEQLKAALGQDPKSHLGELPSSQAMSAASPRPKGSDGPESHWATGHMMASPAQGPKIPPRDESVAKQLTSDLSSALGAYKAGSSALGPSLATNPASMTVASIGASALALVDDGLVDAIDGVAKATFDVAIDCVDELVELLETPWDIPVLTWVYTNVIAKGSTFDLLDVACLATAIPATITYKLATDATPFAHVDHTSLDGVRSISALLPVLEGEGASVGGGVAGAKLALGVTTKNEDDDAPALSAGQLASGVLGSCAGLATILYAVVDTAMAAESDRIGTKAGNGLKTVFGLLTTVPSVITIAIVLNDDETIPPLPWEVFVSWYQFVFVVKDAMTWAYLGHGGQGVVARGLSSLLSLLESLLGLINFIFFATLAIAEAADQRMNAGNILKTIQNVLLSVTQMLALPLEDPDPESRTALLVVHGGAGVSSGLISLIRAIADAADHRVHVVN